MVYPSGDKDRKHEKSQEQLKAITSSTFEQQWHSLATRGKHTKPGQTLVGVPLRALQRLGVQVGALREGSYYVGDTVILAGDLGDRGNCLIVFQVTCEL